MTLEPRLGSVVEQNSEQEMTDALPPSSGGNKDGVVLSPVVLWKLSPW